VSPAIPLAALTVFATLLGGRIGLRFSDRLPTLLALTGGIVVAVALLDVLPEGLDAVSDDNLATALVAAGFLGFFLVARILVLHDRDEAMATLGSERVGVLGAAGLSAHSFMDGLGIGFAFGVDSATGLLVFLAVISHDFADGLNTVSYVLRRSGNRKAAVKWLAIDALAPLLGAIVGSQISISDQDLGYALCVYCGIFLYIGAADLLPEAHAQGSALRVALTALGFLFVFAVTRLAGV
jgi:ZIP family zinc transporter